MKPRVLIVDDSWSMRQTLRLVLTPDFECAMAESGTCALAHARQSPPDIILSDVLMDGMDGYELRRRMRAEPALEKVPFIFLSGREPQPGQPMGSDLHLLKPVRPELLLSRMMELLEPVRPSLRQARG